jgi:hypothetical protein
MTQSEIIKTVSERFKILLNENGFKRRGDVYCSNKLLSKLQVNIHTFIHI